jgi:type I restriction enzyme S subunit
MGSEWTTALLEDVAEIIDSRHSTPTYSETGYPMVRVVDIKGGALNLSETKRVSREVYKDFSKGRTPNIGDLVISRVGSYGIVSYVNSAQEFCLGQNTAFIVPKLNWRFLYYHLKSPSTKKQIDELAVGAVQKTISLASIKKLRISVPPQAEQEQIAQILGALDDKIELNRQMNATLEAMAQALFKSWFVDFDPVLDNALAAGNPIPEELQARAQARQALGDNRKLLPEDLRKQFPARFVLTEEMGWVPEAWEVGPIAKLAELNPESWSYANAPEHVEYVDLSNAKNGRIESTITYAFHQAPSRARRILKKDDTIVGTVRPGNRSFAYVQSDGLTGSTGFAVMRPKKPCYRTFVYLALTQDSVIEHLAHIADGGAYPAIRPDVVAEQVFCLPSNEALCWFDEISRSWLSRIGLNDSENLSLLATRDELLPKLLAGKLKVTNSNGTQALIA